MLRLRPATTDDWARLFAWRNDPETRRRFTSNQPVLLDDHLKWLEDTLDDEKIHLFVADDQEASGSVGTIRFDIVKRKKEDWGDVSITVEPKVRGSGYGKAIIAAMVDQALNIPLGGLIAKIMVDNYASMRAFAANGFTIAKVVDDVVTLERELP